MSEQQRLQRATQAVTRVEHVLQRLFGMLMGLVLMLVGVGVYTYLRYSHAEQQLHGLEIGLIVFFEMLGATLLMGQRLVAFFISGVVIKLLRTGVELWYGRKARRDGDRGEE